MEQQAQQERQVTLNLTINQLNTVLAGVVKLPIEVGLEAFNVIQQQAQSQLGSPNTAQGPLADKVIQ